MLKTRIQQIQITASKPHFMTKTALCHCFGFSSNYFFLFTQKDIHGMEKVQKKITDHTFLKGIVLKMRKGK